MLILASSSPRRRQLLGWLEQPFDICVADIDETVCPGESPDQYTLRLAREKAAAVMARADWAAGTLILASDTTVAVDGDILGKPRDGAEAESMLRRLRGRSHQVFTALALARPDQPTLTELCQVDVPMRAYSDSELAAYVASGDPLDKAGAYAIQNSAFHPVETLQGCFAAVMGLPLCHVLRLLRQAAAPQPAIQMAARCRSGLNYDCPVSTRIYDPAA